MKLILGNLAARHPWPLCSLMIAIVLRLSVTSAGADRIWWDGTHDEENVPPGKLLSDNDGYWGESVLTGVE